MKQHPEQPESVPSSVDVDLGALQREVEASMELQEIDHEQLALLTRLQGIEPEIADPHDVLPVGHTWYVFWTGKTLRVIAEFQDDSELLTVSDEMSKEQMLQEQQLLVERQGVQYYVTLPAGANEEATRVATVEKYTAKLEGLKGKEVAGADLQAVYDAATSTISLQSGSGATVTRIDLTRYPDHIKTQWQELVERSVQHNGKTYDITLRNDDGYLQVEAVEVGQGVRSVKEKVILRDGTVSPDYQATRQGGRAVLINNDGRVVYRFDELDELMIGGEQTDRTVELDDYLWDITIRNEQTVGQVQLEQMTEGVHRIGQITATTPSLPGTWYAHLENEMITVQNPNYSEAIRLKTNQLTTFGETVSEKETVNGREVSVTFTNERGNVEIDIVQAGVEVDEQVRQQGGAIKRMGASKYLDGGRFVYYAEKVPLLESAGDEQLEEPVYLDYEGGELVAKVKELRLEGLVGPSFSDYLDQDDTLFTINPDYHKGPDYTTSYTDLDGYVWTVKAVLDAMDIDNDQQPENVLRVQVDPPEELVEPPAPEPAPQDTTQQPTDKETGPVFVIPDIEFPELDFDIITKKDWEKAKEKLRERFEQASGMIDNYLSNEQRLDDDEQFEVGSETLSMYDKTVYPLGKATVDQVEELYVTATDDGLVVYHNDSYVFDSDMFTIPHPAPSTYPDGYPDGHTDKIPTQLNGKKVVWRFQLSKDTIQHNGSTETVVRVSVEPPQAFLDQLDARETNESAERLEKNFAWPLDIAKTTITGTYNEPRGSHLHAGIDINAEQGDPVYAAHAGVVALTGYDASGYGEYMVVRHKVGGDQYYTLYGHLEAGSTTFTETEKIQRGQQLGVAGNTGHARGPTGIHLHFEVREFDKGYDDVDFLKYRKPVNPMDFYNMSNPRAPEKIAPPARNVDKFDADDIYPELSSSSREEPKKGFQYDSEMRYQYYTEVFFKSKALADQYEWLSDLTWSLSYDEDRDEHLLSLDDKDGNSLTGVVSVTDIVEDGHEIVSVMRGNEEYKVRIVPHTGKDGSTDYILGFVVTNIETY